MRGLMFSVFCVAAIVGSASLGHGQVDDDDAVFRKALDLYEAKDFETAWSLFEVAASEDASNPRPHYYLGDLAVKLGKPLPVALAHFRRALDLSGGDPTFRSEAMAEVKKLERLIRNEEEATRARNKAAREKEEALDRARRELNAEAARFLASLRGKWISFGGEFRREDNTRESRHFWEACAKLSGYKLKDGVLSDIAFEVWEGAQWIVTELPERTEERYYGYARSRFSIARPARLVSCAKAGAGTHSDNL